MDTDSLSMLSLYLLLLLAADLQPKERHHRGWVSRADSQFLSIAKTNQETSLSGIDNYGVPRSVCGACVGAVQDRSCWSIVDCNLRDANVAFVREVASE